MKATLAVVLVGGLAAVLVLGWPTLYRYDALELERYGRFVVRIQRVTGESEILTPSGWKPLDSHRGFLRFGEEPFEAALTVRRDREPLPPRPLPEFDLAAIQGRATLTQQGLLSVTVYNGSERDLTAIDVEVKVAADIDGRAVSREYRVRPAGGFPSKQVTTAFVETAIILPPPKDPPEDPPAKLEWSWGPVRAWGLG